MKRLLAVVAVATLLATNAFAQFNANVAGAVEFDTSLIRGNSSKDSILQAGGTGRREARIQFTFSNNDVVGGFVRFDAWRDSNADPDLFATLWWRPIQQVRFQIGRWRDGEWGGAQITGWGWNGSAQNFVAVDNDDMNERVAASWARRIGYYGGFGERGATISIFPIPNLTLNFGIPFSSRANSGLFSNNIPSAEQVYSKIHGQLRYDLPDVGTLRFSIVGGPGYRDAGSKEWGTTATTGVTVPDGVLLPPAPSTGFLYDPTQLHASFFLTMLRPIELDFGVSYFVPVVGDKGSPVIPETTIYNPVRLGIGFRYTSGAIGLRARLGTAFGGGIKLKDEDLIDYPVVFAINVLPSYDLGFMRVFFNAGLGIEAVSNWEKVRDNGYIAKTNLGNFSNTGNNTSTGFIGFSDFVQNESNTVVSWYINPYVSKGIGPASVFAGFKLFSNGVKYDGDKGDKTVVHWSIPIGMLYNF